MRPETRWATIPTDYWVVRGEEADLLQRHLTTVPVIQLDCEVGLVVAGDGGGVEVVQLAGPVNTHPGPQRQLAHTARQHLQHLHHKNNSCYSKLTLLGNQKFACRAY